MGARKLTDRQRLDNLERVIAAGIGTFREVGTALLEIRDSRLYRQTHATFEAYCADRWGFGRAHAFRLIVASEIVSNLEARGLEGPANESQARELAKLPAESQPAAWEAATAGGASPTAARVAELIAKAKASVPAGRLAEQPPERQREAILAAERSLRERDAEEAKQVGGEGRKDRLAAGERKLRQAAKIIGGLGDEAGPVLESITEALERLALLPAA